MAYSKSHFPKSSWFKRLVYAILGSAILGLLLGLSVGLALFVITNEIDERQTKRVFDWSMIVPFVSPERLA
jgi:ABC-type polysaccharide transport system permease subunit